jgi:hypothetical protein
MNGGSYNGFDFLQGTLKETLQELLGELQVFCDPPTEKDGVITLKMKRETCATSNGYRKFLAFIASRRKLLTKDIKFKEEKNYITFDLVSFHAERLRAFFPKVNQEAVIESMKYLLELGWTEKNFAQVGINHSRFFRYKTKLRKAESVSIDTTK